MKVVVGLGNPSPEYAATRHNVGFRVVEMFAAIHRVPLKTMQKQVRVGQVSGELWVAEPLTWMNHSGQAVRWLLEETGSGVESLIVVHDDLDLPVGRLRFKRRGGHGGHNGVRSIVETMGTGEFLRLKLGVGRPPAGKDPVEYVLEPFSRYETADIDAAVGTACEALDVALAEGVTAAMNRFHAA